MPASSTSTSAGPTTRRLWLFRLPSYKRHSQPQPRTPPDAALVPDLIRSGPSSSSSHEMPSTPVNAPILDQTRPKRAPIRSRLSLDAHTPISPVQSQYFPPGAETEPNSHSIGTLAKEPFRKLRKLRKKKPQEVSETENMPPPSSFMYNVHHDGMYISRRSGMASAPTTVRPLSRRLSDRLFPSRTSIALSDAPDDNASYNPYLPQDSTAYVIDPSQPFELNPLETGPSSPIASTASLSHCHSPPRRSAHSLKAYSEDGHASHHRGFECQPQLRPSPSATFVRGSWASEGQPRPFSVVSSNSYASTSAVLHQPMSTSETTLGKMRRHSRKLMKRRPSQSEVGDIPMASAASAPMTRPRITTQAIAPAWHTESAVPQRRQPLQRTALKPRSATEYNQEYLQRPLPDVPPVLPPITSVITPPNSPPTRSSSWLPLTPPSSNPTSPQLAALSQLSLDADSSMIAARISSGASIAQMLPTPPPERAPPQPMISGQDWIIGEESEPGSLISFDPYAESNRNSLAPSDARKRQRSASRSQRSHESHRVGSSRSRSRGRRELSKSPTRQGHARSRSRSVGRGPLASATGSFVRMRGTREANPMRRWTLAMVDSCYDAAVLQEFDALSRAKKSGDKDSRPRKRRSIGVLDENGEEDSEAAQRHALHVVYGGPPNDARLGVDEDSMQRARRALLSCRELIRTEKAYQTNLLSLLQGKTKTTPPALMLTYLPALVLASTEFLAALAEDPTAYGAANALSSLVSTMESAFVPWCGVVGQWFSESSISENFDKLKRPKGSSPSTSRATTVAFRSKTVGKGNRNSLLAASESSSPLNPSRPVLSSIMPWINNTPTNTSPEAVPFPASPAPDVNLLTLRLRSTLSPSTSMTSLADTSESAEPLRERIDSLAFSDNGGKIPTVRDLAIQPTQRVMRYVLQYRDLLNQTPAGCPTHAALGQALEAATALAHKCDRAQDNASFLRSRA